MFREKTTSALVGFHAAPLSMSNQSLEVLAVFRRESPEKPQQAEKTRPTYDTRL